MKIIDAKVGKNKIISTKLLSTDLRIFPSFFTKRTLDFFKNNEKNIGVGRQKDIYLIIQN